MSTKSCIMCGGTFHAHTSRHLTCSAKCSHERDKLCKRNARKRRFPRMKACVVCDGQFQTKTNTRTCSADCYREHNKRKQQNLRHKRAPNICVICSQAFETNRPRKLACSTECH